MLRILDIGEADELLQRKAVRLAEAERTVAPILEDVRRRGDAAVLEYARKFDGFTGTSFEVRGPAPQAAPDFLDAVRVAAENIREYARLQLPSDRWVNLPGGRRLGHVVRPLESMGAYIPAGRYPLPSTLLMTIIPAQVAGVRNICVTCPKPSTEILAAFEFLKTGRMFQIGGAQAIAAMAFGT